MDQTSAAPAQLVVFDFDGTSITGNSPVMLVQWLFSRGMLNKRTISRVVGWGLAYKLRLPQNEAWVRSQVFTAFDGMPKAQADAIMRQFYDERIAKRVRAKLDPTIARHHAEGREVLVVSASFEPIILRAMEQHAWDHQFSTRMKVDAAGCYTREVDGNPVEGAEKLRLVERYADRKYGAGKWEISHAYGDHHSDRSLLFAARNPIAVTPDRPLARTAAREGWTVLDWA